VKKIRIRGENNVNDYLHFVRFQAFNFSEIQATAELPTALPVKEAGNL
jgi:hypothetical protein